VVVWLWDAHGPDCARQGITDDRARALQQAEAYVISGTASGARVELAQLVTGFRELTACYRRTGHGWTAQHHDGAVTWVPLLRRTS
jgi:hypothetical protein